MSRKQARFGQPAVYNASAPSLADGEDSALSVDASQRLITSNGTLLAGEDLTNNRLMVEERFSYQSINTAATTTIKSSAGFFNSMTIWGGTAGAITVYDNTAGSGTAIVPTFTPGSVSVSVTNILNVSFATGLTIVTAAATVISVSYR